MEVSCCDTDRGKGKRTHIPLSSYLDQNLPCRKDIQDATLELEEKVSRSPAPSLRISLAPNFSKSIIALLSLQKLIKLHSHRMMSLRSFSRALPRSVPKILARCQPRTFSSLPRASVLQTTKTTSIPKYAAFSTSRAARAREGQGRMILS